ncbi:MAG: SPFH domain-containing protein [archaeon]|nr:SPFH domain-containing protein [archaeon]
MQAEATETGSSAAGILGTLGVFLFIAALAGVVILYAFRYKIAPSDKILVIYGSGPGMKGKTAETIHGGGRLVIPLIQHYAYLDLKPLTISIDLRHALSMQNIRVNVPSTFTIGVSTEPQIMTNAAERLLGLSPQGVEDMAKEIIFGQLRLTVASLTIEEINQDREAFLTSVSKNVDAELHKIGLYLINVNITDITDESNYIENIGRKAAAEANNKALVDVANSDREGAIGVAAADRDREIEVARNEAASAKGQKQAEADRRVFIQQQEATAVEGENLARADIASTNADLAEREAEALQRSEVARRQAQAEIERAQYTLESERLRAEEIAREEVAKAQIEIAAEAEAERQRRIARGEADAILARYNAEAEGTKAVLAAKASGYKDLVSSTGGDPRAAATLLMVEKIEAIVAKQVEAISNLTIDKITVWDSGGSGDGSSTSNFVSSLIKSLPPVHDVAKMAGVDLPDYLGSMQDDA